MRPPDQLATAIITISWPGRRPRRTSLNDRWHRWSGPAAAGGWSINYGNDRTGDVDAKAAQESLAPGA